VQASNISYYIYIVICCFIILLLISPVYTTLNFWYGTDKIGTRTNQKSGTVPKIERSVNGAQNIGSPRTKKVVRVPILSVPYQKLSVV
jgi:hypothetical protein